MKMTPTKAQRPSRSADLSTLVGALNIWALAPNDSHRTEGLRLALRQYQQAVKTGNYRALSSDLCTIRGAARMTPPPPKRDFESLFGECPEAAKQRDNREEAPAGSISLPWED